MMNLLHTIGLMTRAEHERLMDAYRDDWKFIADKALGQRDYFEAKFKRAATDLAAQTDKLAMLENLNVILLEANADLRPDAEAMRKKRDADRKRMAGKRNG